MSASSGDSEAPVLWPLSDKARDGIKAMLERLAAVDDATGGWTTKTDCRQTGLTYYVKFEQKAPDVMAAMDFMALLNKSLPWLAEVCRRLLLADEAQQGREVASDA